jgi:hypothetical protein
MKKSPCVFLKYFLCLFLFNWGITEIKAQKQEILKSNYDFDTATIYLIKLKDESSFTGKFLEKKRQSCCFYIKNIKT